MVPRVSLMSPWSAPRRFVVASAGIACVLLSVPSATSTAQAATGPVWTAVSVPQPSMGSAYLQSVATARGGTVWAAGYYWYDSSFTGNVIHETYALVGQGSSWQVVPTQNPGVTSGSGDDELLGVDATGPASAWMAGVQSTSAGIQPLVEHADDGTVAVVPLPQSPGNEGQANAITGPAGDLWVVGEGAPGGSIAQGEVWHQAGSRWAQVPFRATVAGCQNQSSTLFSVTQPSPGKVYVGGTCFHSGQGWAGFVELYSSGHWSSVAHTSPADGSQFEDLTTSPDGTVYGSGSELEPAPRNARALGLAISASGLTWLDNPYNSPGNDFSGIAATHSNVFAVGDGTSPQPPFAGFGAYRLDGRKWVEEPVVTPYDGFGRLYSVAIDSSGDAVAVGFGILSSGATQALVAYRGA
jgi:hypothetical protein